ncbi:acyl-CoA reductase LuxC [Neolewinella xylanilytica]|uniref:Acyl-CoA reductase LuxC n=1 Tax=Neolewinella xylanilytica TaxID=1514080 RepID=A0A2S6I4M7_9BACT|nr:acyl-CoA reductase [Neolewinella xylanilytica]PPK86110.1 acyl-CoA reductase LuxC [Neolewinella xylanilytica]
MTLPERIAALHRLGQEIRPDTNEFLAALMKRTAFHNGWFTPEAQRRSLDAVITEFLDGDKLRDWAAGYPELAAPAPRRPKTVGLVLAGNIPLVGMHDLVTVFLSGHRAQIKLSSKDPYVLPYLLRLLGEVAPATLPYFEIVDKLTAFDAIIATGSNNSSRYFEAYFGKYPHIIRRNRNAVAVLTGEEDRDALRRLGDDVFSYFGLGCRNVSKLYVPEGYDFEPLLEVFHEWKVLQNHTKWKNNFDYNFALLTLNKEAFHHNGAIILRRDEALASHIAGLYYTTYTDLGAAAQEINERSGEIQLVVTRPGTLPFPTVDFGHAQQPGLTDYADGVDTLAFLTTLP